MSRLNIVLAQMTQNMGDLPGNAAAMLAVRDRFPDVALIVFPELQLIGYPPEDLVMKPALVARADEELAKLALATATGPALLVGTVARSEAGLHNAVALLDGGKIAAIRYKHELPNYGTFDEKRLFATGPLPRTDRF